MSTEKTGVDRALDLRGVPCPQNYSRAFLQLEIMDEGEILKLLVDDGEPVDNVQSELEEEGHTVIFRKQNSSDSWELRIRREDV